MQRRLHWPYYYCVILINICIKPYQNNANFACKCAHSGQALIVSDMYLHGQPLCAKITVLVTKSHQACLSVFYPPCFTGCFSQATLNLCGPLNNPCLNNGKFISKMRRQCSCWSLSLQRFTELRCESRMTNALQVRTEKLESDLIL